MESAWHPVEVVLDNADPYWAEVEGCAFGEPAASTTSLRPVGKLALRLLLGCGGVEGPQPGAAADDDDEQDDD